MKDRINLFVMVLNLVMLAAIAASGWDRDRIFATQNRAMRETLGLLPEVVPVFCRKVACHCQREPGGCQCCRCGGLE